MIIIIITKIIQVSDTEKKCCGICAFFFAENASHKSGFSDEATGWPRADHIGLGSQINKERTETHTKKSHSSHGNRSGPAVSRPVLCLS